ncbi:MAG: hypothetical protein KKH12_03030 [Gammaproteobacteria bacterium]|nr:hypothetical protein [Gammaproteobacteria bacterium]MBU1480628.1 hypothetical protein [Gammaproteobacteria bacterium]
MELWPNNVWIALVAVITLIIVMQFAFDAFILAIGSLIVWVLSAGRIKTGERRVIGKSPPKPNGGQIFYYENSATYMYQNFVALVGLVFVLSGLTAIFGYGMWTTAL